MTTTTGPDARPDFEQAGAPDRMPVPPRPGRSRLVTVGVIVSALLVVAHVFAFQATEFSPGALVNGWRGIARFLGEAIPPD